MPTSLIESKKISQCVGDSGESGWLRGETWCDHDLPKLYHHFSSSYGIMESIGQRTSHSGQEVPGARLFCFPALNELATSHKSYRNRDWKEE